MKFGVRWLFKRLQINANSYYFYKKNKENRRQKLKRINKIFNKTSEICHANNGVPGYRMMTYELRKFGINLSSNTVYEYMKRLKLRSITRQKYIYKKGEAHKTFSNLLNRDFTATRPNEKWCTDFTYLKLSSGEKRYNCSVLDLYDRSIVVSITSDKMDAILAIKTLQTSINAQKTIPRGIILHSDQGCQFTSKAFCPAIIEL